MSAREYAERDVRTGPVAKLLAEAKAQKDEKKLGPSL